MADTVRAAIQALEAKALELIEERDCIRKRLIEDAARDMQIERDINGCVAGARALEFDLELPKAPALSQQQQQALNNFISGRTSLALNAPALKPIFGVEDDDGEPDETSVNRDQDMPRLADIIVDRLTVAGEEGSKAAAIRRYIRNTYNADIHEKSVGMTLYRLQSAGRVRRDGQTWFLASPEAKNPGESPPGLINSVDRKE